MAKLFATAMNAYAFEQIAETLKELTIDKSEAVGTLTTGVMVAIDKLESKKAKLLDKKRKELLEGGEPYATPK